jgi:hypothetical protein
MTGVSARPVQSCSSSQVRSGEVPQDVVPASLRQIRHWLGSVIFYTVPESLYDGVNTQRE